MPKGLPTECSSCSIKYRRGIALEELEGRISRLTRQLVNPPHEQRATRLEIGTKSSRRSLDIVPRENKLEPLDQFLDAGLDGVKYHDRDIGDFVDYRQDPLPTHSESDLQGNGSWL